MDELETDDPTPTLRFPAFEEEGAWHHATLHDLALPVKDKATGGDNEDTLTLSGEVGLVPQGDYFGKQISGENVSRYIKIGRDDFVYNDRTTKASKFGSIKRLTSANGGIVSPIYKCFRFNPGQNSDFWDYYFEAQAHEAQLGGLVNEGARAGRFNISIDKFLSIDVWKPSTLEQERIAECLSSIDALIKAETEKLDALKDHKQGLMQRLFPAEGENLPKIRFPEFSETALWKKTTLASVIDLISGLHLSPDDYSETGSLPYFTGPSDFTHDVEQVTKWTDKTTNVATTGDILITVKGSGVGELWDLALPEVALGRQLMAVRANACETPFLFQFLQTRRAEFVAMASGNLIPGLSRNDILSMEIYLPKPAEQRLISSCLSSVAGLIKQQEIRTSNLKLHKLGLLQQLFPVLDEVQG